MREKLRKYGSDILYYSLSFIAVFYCYADRMAGPSS